MRAREWIKICNKGQVKRKDRIKYQLFKQKMNIYDLYRKRNAEGECYKKEKERFSDFEKSEITRNAIYMSKEPDMPKEAYQELCKRLRIEVEIDGREKYEIEQWLKLVEKYKKGKLTDKENKEKQELVTEVEKQVPEYYDEGYIWEKEIREDEIQKKWFLSHASEFSQEVLRIWYKYAEFYECEFIAELEFINLYSQINEMGKKIFHETILQCFNEKDYKYEDERTKLYRKLEEADLLNIDVDIDSIKVKEIYELWATSYSFDTEYFVLMENITDKIIEFTHDDWQCVIDYHRIRMTGTENIIEEQTFLDYLEKTFYIIAGIPSFS